MPRKRMLWQLYPSYLLITFLALALVAWYAIRSQRHTYLDQTAIDLEARARLVMYQITSLLNEGDTAAVNSLCKELGRRTDTRITVVLQSGQVIGDSDHPPDDMEDHRTRPEITAALSQGKGVSTRYSNTLQNNMMYVAVRFTDGGLTAGVVRTSIPVTFIDQVTAATRARIFGAGLVVTVLAAVIGLIVSRRLSRPLEELKKGAERFASGNLDQPLEVPESEEVGGLATAMNKMAAELSQRIGLMTRQRREQEAILRSMVEGVLAVDLEERIIRINEAATRLLDIDPEKVTGLSIQEAVRNSALQRMVGRVLQTRQPIRDEVIFLNQPERYAQVSAVILHAAQSRDIGALLVLNDITRLRRLEKVRRDFVANVSHELKTPITSIRASLETILDGAIRNTEDTGRFLSMALRQTDRLSQIVEDLLNLSRVEEESERGQIIRTATSVEAVMRSATAACESTAYERNVALRLECPDDLQMLVNQPMLERAVTNLIDNAIKFSPADGSVQIRAATDGNRVAISVADQGCGIPEQHLGRLFERFYRVDQARSREMGGTGLGLAIVKHVALAHGGGVAVKSTPGKGSTFTITLPRD